MKNRYTRIAVFSAVCSFIIVFAGAFFISPANAQSVDIAALLKQIAELQAQLKKLQAQVDAAREFQPPAFCHDFGEQLRLGDEGKEVKALQEALKKEDVHPGLIADGAFDVLTFRALVKFQEKYRSEVLRPFGLTRGTGFMGRETMKKLNALYGCKDEIPIVLPEPEPIIIPPIQQGNPVIDGVEGPTFLKVNEEGTWTIKARDPENGRLSYSVSWGDEFYALTPQSKPFQELSQTATFTHRYTNSGLYTVRFTVSDDQNLSAKTSISVNVVSKETKNNPPRITVKPIVPDRVVINEKLPLRFQASDTDGDNLAWSIDWGAGGVAESCPAYGSPYGQPYSYSGRNSWTFNVAPSWSNAGIYLVNVSVSDCNGGSDSYSFKVNVVSATTQPSITVLSPNGGETWTKGTMQTIKWQDNTSIPSCPIGAICAPAAPKYYDIKLVPYYSPCTGAVCPALYIAPYTIAKNTYGSSYSWSVGKVLDISGTGVTVSDGSYTIQICKTGSMICDSSDSYFKIVSIGTNNSPVIDVIPTGPFDIKVGQSVSFIWGATDADGDNLAWSVSWGDETGMAGACAFPNPQNKQNRTFIASHAWTNAGTYTVKVTVNDCRGGSDEHAFNVVVGSSVVPPITVLSPNSGEQWIAGQTYKITWNSQNVRAVGISLYKGFNYERIITSNYPESGIYKGNYTWKIPLDVKSGSDYTIRVINTDDTNFYDDSDYYFSVATEVLVSYSAPEMVYPQDKQTLDYGGGYMFKVKPVAGASGYLFGFFQNGIMIYENWRDDTKLSVDGEFGVWQDNPYYSKFQEGPVKVIVRASINGQWSDAREITINLVKKAVGLPDLEVRNVTRGTDFHPYGFHLTVCMGGPKSINDLKPESSAVTHYPVAYYVYDSAGVKHKGDIGVSGEPENLKNGSCSTYGGTIQQSEQMYFDQTGKVEFTADPNNIINEANEQNNTFTLASQVDKAELHSVTIESGNLKVTYSKNFATCAHLQTSTGILTHIQNHFCEQGSQITVTRPLSDFSNIDQGKDVKLCHGNNSNICSPLIKVQ